MHSHPLPKGPFWKEKKTKKTAAISLKRTINDNISFSQLGEVQMSSEDEALSKWIYMCNTWSVEVQAALCAVIIQCVQTQAG